MRAILLLSALALAASAAAFAPSAAAMQMPPPCQTVTTCCPLETQFAPCCTLLSCLPSIVRCPETSVDSTDYVEFLGPGATVATHYNCTAQACVQSTCCGLAGLQSVCSTLCAPPVESAAAMATALPVPQVSVVQNPDCTYTVTETIASCPNGFWKSTIYYTVQPIHFVLDDCVPMCACMPLEAAPAAPEGSA